MNLKDKIAERINQLSTEVETLVEERANHYQRIDEINTHIAHLVGALKELDALSKEDSDEVK